MWDSRRSPSQIPHVHYHIFNWLSGSLTWSVCREMLNKTLRGEETTGWWQPPVKPSFKWPVSGCKWAAPQTHLTHVGVLKNAKREGKKMDLCRNMSNHSVSLTMIGKVRVIQSSMKVKIVINEFPVFIITFIIYIFVNDMLSDFCFLFYFYSFGGRESDPPNLSELCFGLLPPTPECKGLSDLAKKYVLKLVAKYVCLSFGAGRVW